MNIKEKQPERAEKKGTKRSGSERELMRQTGRKIEREGAGESP